MTKVIVLSYYPLPYSKTGSWTTLYKNYITQHQHLIDYIVCPEPHQRFDQVGYSPVDNSFPTRLQRKFSGKKYSAYFKAIKRIVRPGEKYVVQIVDNQGITAPLDAFLKEHHLRGQFYLQYFHHGFGPINTNARSMPIFDAIDELILLTYDSYKEYLDYYSILPLKVSVLHNGIDTAKFCKPTPQQKESLQQAFEINDKKVFIWCSQDRPKKGLNIILEAWRKVYAKRQDIVLLVVGVDRAPVDGVRFIGPVPNDELPQYFQAADAYLFSTLCKEGFGLTLIEALHCGNYCIASGLGGVPEVLQYGKLGSLIAEPHFVASWVAAIHEYLENPKSVSFSTDLYSATSWNNSMDQIISDAKNSISL